MVTEKQSSGMKGDKIRVRCELNIRNSEISKYQSGCREPLVTLFDQPNCGQPFWILTMAPDNRTNKPTFCSPVTLAR